MRVGRNPAKTTAETTVEVNVPAPVSVGLLTHVPFIGGYHEDALDVLRLAVASARSAAGRPIHLVVVDNGSCAEVRAWLLDAYDEGSVDQLVLNRHNLGKATGMSQIIGGSPGPHVVYADGDVRFMPGWLDALFSVVDAFPEAGMVSGWPPLSSEARLSTTASLAFVTDPPAGVTVDRGQLVDEAHVRSLLADTGIEGDELSVRLRELQRHDDVRLRRDGVVAFVGATHCQFLLPAPARLRLGFRVGSLGLDPLEDQAFDDAIDELGMLRLSVAEPVMRHLGNRLSEDDRHELARLEGRELEPRRVKRPLSAALFQRAQVRLVLRRLHQWTFRALYESSAPEPGRVRRVKSPSDGSTSS